MKNLIKKIHEKELQIKVRRMELNEEYRSLGKSLIGKLTSPFSFALAFSTGFLITKKLVDKNNKLESHVASATSAVTNQRRKKVPYLELVPLFVSVINKYF